MTYTGCDICGLCDIYGLCDMYGLCDIYWPNLTNQKITGQFLAGQKGSPDFSMKV